MGNFYDPLAKPREETASIIAEIKKEFGTVKEDIEEAYNSEYVEGIQNPDQEELDEDF